MPEPIIIDDGGSTRIKHIVQSGVGEMDDLLTVRKRGEDPKRGKKGSQNVLARPFTRVRIVCQGSRGNAGEFEFPNAEVTGPFEKIEIVSELKQSVLFENRTLNGRQDLILVVYGEEDEIGPIIEAKQHNDQRRYVVSNAGPITEVKINGERVYHAKEKLPEGCDATALYTSVVLGFDYDIPASGS